MLQLDVIDISGESEIRQYKSHLSSIDRFNPYSRYELIRTEGKGQEGSLKYFLFSENGVPAVIMPFYLKPIAFGNEATPYFDVSSPWGYTGPIVSDQKLDLLKTFWNEVDSWYVNNNVITEFIRFNLSGNHVHYSGTTIHTLYNIRGALLSEEEVWGNFKRSVRKNYNKASKSGLRFDIFHHSIPKEKISEYYGIWEGTMNRLNADDTYYHSLQYFEDIVTLNQDCCALALVYNAKGEPISTELLLLSNDTVYSYLGGTKADFFHLRPNDLLKIEVMNWARDHGFKYYLLGGGLKDGDSLYQYKKKFFPEDPEISFKTGRKILNQEIYKELVLASGNSPDDEKANMDIQTGFFPKYRKVSNEMDA